VHQLLGGSIDDALRRLTLFTEDLLSLLGDYLITGGIPRAIEEYLGSGRISRGTFDTYVDLVIRDARKWGANENTLRQVVREVADNVGQMISYNFVAKRTEIASHKTVAEYVETLKDSFVLSYLYQLDEGSQAPKYRDREKIFFADPFMFHALRAWATGAGADPFENRCEQKKNCVAEGSPSRREHATDGKRVCDCAAGSVSVAGLM
jgi:hypothetical protein